MKGPSAIILTAALLLPITADADCVEAHWIPFEAELYVPESEATIEKNAFEHNTMPLSVATSLDPMDYPVTQVPDYSPRDVRAVIHLPGANIYIDRSGWIRQGNLYGKADVSTLEEKLSTACSDR